MIGIDVSLKQKTGSVKSQPVPDRSNLWAHFSDFFYVAASRPANHHEFRLSFNPFAAANQFSRRDMKVRQNFQIDLDLKKIYRDLGSQKVFKMREIQISTKVFAQIWALREEGEESEDQILGRVLHEFSKLNERQKDMLPRTSLNEKRSNFQIDRKVRWIDDVTDALTEIGRRAHLTEIYAAVVKIRTAAGRSLPESTEAIIRRTLEENSADTHSFKGIDRFCITDGKGAGFWALRSR